MMKFMRVIALSFVLMLTLCLSAVAQTGFVTEPLSEEYRGMRDNGGFVSLDSTPPHWPIDCFDMREDHWLLVCSDRMATKVIAVYDENGVFQYGFKTEWIGGCAAEWYGDYILFYSVRGGMAWIVDETAQVVDIHRVPSTYENSCYMQQTVLSTSRVVDDITYTAVNDNILTAVLSGTFAYIEKNDGDTVMVLYDAHDIQQKECITRTAILLGVIGVIGLMVWVGVRQTVRSYCSSVALSREQLLKNTHTSDVVFYIHDTLPSTNATAKELAANGAAEGTVVLAASQTAGRGRLGRSFCSPDGTGVYMSIILRPRLAAEKALMITTAAAVAVCRALESLGADATRIKWVNDVYCRERKVCGILTEAAFDGAGGLSYAVLGIGINVAEPAGGFPAELSDIAGAAFAADTVTREQVIAAVIDTFFEEYAMLSEERFVEEYRARSLLVDRAVTVITPNGNREATALGVDEACRLRVRYADGSEETLSSGDVSIRMG